MNDEVWKDIKDYEGLYQVSNLGRVKSLKMWNNNKHIKGYIQRDKILKPKLNRNTGYYYVTLYKEKDKARYFTIHRLTAQAFLDNPNCYPCINHIDGNKKNNSIDNLEWCSYKHNSREAHRLGLSKNPPIIKYWENKFGKEHPASKKVYQINKDTKQIINEFNSVSEASREMGFKASGISGVASGHRKSYMGYIWVYE